MQEIYFLARHTPFWAVPLIVLGGEFAYLFWLKRRKAAVALCLIIAFIGLVSTSFYIWTGGPEKSVRYLKTLHRNSQ